MLAFTTFLVSGISPDAVSNVRMQDSPCISQPTHLLLVPNTSGCLVMPQTDIQPDDEGLKMIAQIDDPEACCAQCMKYNINRTRKQQCKAWTLYQNSCYLKPRMDSHTPSAAVTASGYIASSPPATCTVLNDTDISPDNVNIMTYSNVTGKDAPAQCCRYCNQFSGCVAWTLYKQSCYLKPGYEGRSTAKGCTSGFVGTEPKPPLPTPAPSQLPAKWPQAGITFTGGRYCPGQIVSNRRRHVEVDSCYIYYTLQFTYKLYIIYI